MGTLRDAARVVDPKTGRVLEVPDHGPGMQLYTANFLDGAAIGKSGKAYGRRSPFVSRRSASRIRRTTRIPHLHLARGREVRLHHGVRFSAE